MVGFKSKNWLKRHAGVLILSIFLPAALIGTAFFAYTRFGVKQASAAGITKYAINAGGNWSADSTWSTTAAKDGTRVANTAAPTALDTVVIDGYSGNQILHGK